MTETQGIQKRYTELLKGYLAEQGETHLLQASELGREMVLAGLPAEEVAEFHAVALQNAISGETNSVSAAIAELGGAPLAELLMAFGLASRAQVSHLESTHESLEKSEQRFKDFADASSDWMWETGPDLRYTSVTDGVKQTIGVASEDYIGKTRREMSLPDEDEDNWSTHMKDLEARRPFQDFTYTALDADGQKRIIRESGKPTVDEEETFLGYRGTGRDITSLIEAQERSARIRQQLSDSLENISEGYCLFDPAGNLIICNSHYRQCYPLIADLLVSGASFEEILRTAAERGRFPEAKGRVDEWVNERLNRHQGEPGVIECLLSDGRWHRISEHSTREGGIVKVLTDITELKKREEALKESEQRLSSLAANLPGIVFRRVLKADGTIEHPYMSAGTKEYFGYDAEKFMTEGSVLLVQLMHPDDEDGYKQALDESARSLSPMDVEFRFTPKSGEERWMHSIARPRRLDNGDVEWDGVALDITKRKRAEQALRENEERVRGVLDNVVHGIVTIDEHGVIESFNAGAEEIFGYKASEVIDKNVKILMPEPYHSEHDGYLDNYLTTGQSAILGVGPREVRGLTKDGKEVPVELAISEMSLGGKRVFIGALVDLTERKETEQKLQQAQKMDAVGQLTGGVAHDFNNLLTVILGNLQLLERQVGDDERLAKRVTAAANAAQRGADLTGRLLAFSRRQVLEAEVADLNELVSGMDDLLRRTLGEAIEIETVLAEDLWPTLLDPSQLENALLNLAVNARDAMEASGQMTIETANATLDEAYAASHDEVEAGDYVMVAVTDTGSGMPPEVAKQAFEPFFTTKETGKGTGLGLSMIYGFVKQSNGTINIYSEEGHGTTFRLYFPRSASADAPAAKEASADEEVPRGSESVLVVEDDAGVREVTVAMMKELGYRVLEAGNGVDALAVLDEHGDIDLLFSDVVMPGGMSGPALGKLVHKRSPEIKILYTSGYTHSAFSRDGNLDPDVSLLSKPFQREELAREVRRVLDDEKDQSEK